MQADAAHDAHAGIVPAWPLSEEPTDMIAILSLGDRSAADQGEAPPSHHRRRPGAICSDAAFVLDTSRLIDEALAKQD